MTTKRKTYTITKDTLNQLVCKHPLNAIAKF